MKNWKSSVHKNNLILLTLSIFIGGSVVVACQGLASHPQSIEDCQDDSDCEDKLLRREQREFIIRDRERQQQACIQGGGLVLIDGNKERWYCVRDR